MTARPVYLLPEEEEQPDYPSTIEAPCAAANNCTPAQAGVGEVAQPGAMTDAELEAAISRAGRALERAQAAVEAGGGFEALGNRDRALASFCALIRMRSPAQIARMQAAQAERMALEPGA